MMIGLFVAATACAVAAGIPAAAATTHADRAKTVPTIPPTEWPAYMNGPGHSNYNAAETAITVTNAKELRQKWEFTGGAGFLSSPTVADGAVYIGANNGWFYKLSEASGKDLDKIFLGFVNNNNCSPNPLGMVSTATVAVAPKTDQLTVYVSGADGYLYAMSASSLKVEWKSVIGLGSSYFDWSSPTVYNGRIYIGVASNCDNPLVRGALISFSQATGGKLGEFYTVPAGSQNAGGSIWSSVGVAPNGDVYATTGNGPLNGNQLLQDSEAIIKLSPTLNFLGRYQISPSDEGYDTDFGASPVFFDQYVGACNKNGTFYAVYQSTMKLAWKRTISGPAGSNAECIAAPIWNGKHLFLATGGPGTVDGTNYVGTLQERDPNGTLVWITGLPNGVNGSPTMDGAGVIAVGTYDYTSTPNATYLYDAANGRWLRKLATGWDFPESVFADNWLFTANGNGVYAWGIGKLG